MRRAWFHIGGVLVVAAAFVGAGGALITATFATSACEHEDRTAQVGQLRLAMVLIVLVFALVPAGWALLARRRGRAWVPYAVVAAASAVGVAVWVAMVDRVASFCM